MISIYFLYHSFLKLQNIRAFPISLPSETRLMSSNNSEKKLLLIGDSRVQMWPEQFYPETYDTINVGVGGHTSAQTLLVLEKIQIPNSSVAFIQVCINDIHWIKALSLSKQRQIIDNCKKNIDSIINILLKKNYKIILSTLFPNANVPISRYLFWSHNTGSIIQELNQYIKQKKSKNIWVLDSFNLLKDEKNYMLLQEYRDDDFFLHLNTLGYKKVSSELNKILFEF
jgi:lysophospholipase L1-like esterase